MIPLSPRWFRVRWFHEALKEARLKRREQAAWVSLEAIHVAEDYHILWIGFRWAVYKEHGRRFKATGDTFGCRGAAVRFVRDLIDHERVSA